MDVNKLSCQIFSVFFFFFPNLCLAFAGLRSRHQLQWLFRTRGPSKHHWAAQDWCFVWKEDCVPKLWNWTTSGYSNRRWPALDNVLLFSWGEISSGGTGTTSTGSRTEQTQLYRQTARWFLKCFVPYSQIILKTSWKQNCCSVWYHLKAVFGQPVNSYMCLNLTFTSRVCF